MSAFLETVNKATGARRYFIDERRVCARTFSIERDRLSIAECFQTHDRGAYWAHYSERRAKA